MTTLEAVPVQEQNLVSDALSPGGQLPDRKGGIFVCVERLGLGEQATEGSVKLVAHKAYRGGVATAIQEFFDIIIQRICR